MLVVILIVLTQLDQCVEIITTQWIWAFLIIIAINIYM